MINQKRVNFYDPSLVICLFCCNEISGPLGSVSVSGSGSQGSQSKTLNMNFVLDAIAIINICINI